MPNRSMYNRRAIRPDGGFHRSKRRSHLAAKTPLEARSGERPRGGFVAGLLKLLLRRRV